jgi:hypothetical protein
LPLRRSFHSCSHHTVLTRQWVIVDIDALSRYLCATSLKITALLFTFFFRSRNQNSCQHTLTFILPLHSRTRRTYLSSAHIVLQQAQDLRGHSNPHLHFLRLSNIAELTITTNRDSTFTYSRAITTHLQLSNHHHNTKVSPSVTRPRTSHQHIPSPIARARSTLSSSPWCVEVESPRLNTH